MLTVGVDLAAEPANTAVARVRWAAGAATVEHVLVGAGDDRLVPEITGAGKAGIDCPLGWPAPFVEFLNQYVAGDLEPGALIGGKGWRGALTLRATDLATRELTGLIPLSVAADRIGHAALRCAGLLARLAAAGQPVDRSGAGAVAEVYPAAALRRWGLDHRNYKGTANATARAELVTKLITGAPWLRLGDHEAHCRRSDHAFDAVIAALNARAAATGRATTPSPGQLGLARIEGWIALPTCDLTDLPAPPDRLDPGTRDAGRPAP